MLPWAMRPDSCLRDGRLQSALLQLAMLRRNANWVGQARLRQPASAGDRRMTDHLSCQQSSRNMCRELLEYITIGDQAELVSADSTIPPMTVSEALMTATAQEDAAEHIVSGSSPGCSATLPSAGTGGQRSTNWPSCRQRRHSGLRGHKLEAAAAAR